jgi:hypothetical protein
VPQLSLGGGRCSWRTTGIAELGLPRPGAPALALTDDTLILAPANTCRNYQPPRRPILALDLATGVWRVVRWISGSVGLQLRARDGWLAIGIYRAPTGSSESVPNGSQIIVLDLRHPRAKPHLQVPTSTQGTSFAIDAQGALLATRGGELREYVPGDAQGRLLAADVEPDVSVSGATMAYEQLQPNGEAVLDTRSLRTGHVRPTVGLGLTRADGFALSGELLAWVEPEGLRHEAPTPSDPCGGFFLTPPILRTVNLAHQHTFLPYVREAEAPLPSGCPTPP